MLIACNDKAFGPKLQNIFSSEALVEIYFDDGTSTKFIWPSCRVSYIAHPNKKIKRIIFKVDNKLFLELDKNRILEIFDTANVAVWSIGPMGVLPSDVTECKNL